MIPAAKAAREAFYVNDKGSPGLEVACIVLCSSLLLVSGEGLRAWLPHDLADKAWVSGVAELVCHVLPLVAVYMGLLPPIPTAAALGAVLLGATVAQLKSTPTENKCKQLRAALLNLISPRKQHINVFRGALILATCIAILAVDFRQAFAGWKLTCLCGKCEGLFLRQSRAASAVPAMSTCRAFPRRYAKTEAVGMSLMDFGVGGIVMAGGLVGPLARAPGCHSTEQRVGILVRRGFDGLWTAAPCIMLWAGRLVSVKAVNYQEQVGEYGVHWNFFATIACVTLANQLVGRGLSSWRLGALAAATTLTHQAALTWGGLGPWVASHLRDPSSWASLNKEGLGSLPGYWALSLWGALLARGLQASFKGPCREALDALVAQPSGGGLSGVQQRDAANGDGASGEQRGPQPGKATGQESGTGGTEGRRRNLRLSAHVGKCPFDRNRPDDGMVRKSEGTTLRLGACLWPLARPVAAWLLVDVLLWLVWGGLELISKGRARAGPGMVRQFVAVMGWLLGARISRRCANMAYAVWLAALILLLLLVLVCASVLLPLGLRPALSLACASHMLPVFLAANVLTGGINLTVDTLTFGDWEGRGIVAVYIACVCALAMELHRLSEQGFLRAN